MLNQQVLQGNWNEIKGKIRSKWGELTNDDVQHFDGNVDRLVGLIQRKTGEGRDSVERFLNEVTSSGGGAVGQATETVRDYAQQAAERIQTGARQAAESVRQGYDSLREGYEGAEEMVRRRPTESAAVCFGLGVLTGLMVAFVIQRK
ncbi:MAG TPA: CsbD family protein [Planctomycetaceae bacterium]|nr:CsbD family protein [Planctomycetaceae bacterium]